MGRLRERLATARRALSTLVELPLAGGATPVERDAAIQRFEYSFEAVWKGAQQFLREQEGLDAASPKGTVRSSLAAGILSDVDARLALQMVDDRNLTAHTYNEALALMIYSRLAEYAAAMTRWVDLMDSRLPGISTGS